MPHFFLKLVAPRPTFATDMTDDEKARMQEHFLYWKSRQDAGEVVVFGPVLDPKGAYGMGVVEAPDEAAAHAFADADPAVRFIRGFNCEIHPMQAVIRDNQNRQ
jgi:uncharacterized protein YciI